MAGGCAWFLVLGSVFLCNLMKALLPSISSFVSAPCLQPVKCLSFRCLLLLLLQRSPGRPANRGAVGVGFHGSPSEITEVQLNPL